MDSFEVQAMPVRCYRVLASRHEREGGAVIAMADQANKIAGAPTNATRKNNMGRLTLVGHLMKYPETFHEPSFSRSGVTVSIAPSLVSN